MPAGPSRRRTKPTSRRTPRANQMPRPPIANCHNRPYMAAIRDFA
jgi:hypothetical protein